jgi:hypothetical protein
MTIAIAEKLMEQIHFHEANAGEKPDSLWLTREEYNAFILELSKQWYDSVARHTKSHPGPEDVTFLGIPVKEMQVIR